MRNRRVHQQTKASSIINDGLKDFCIKD